MNRRFIQTAFLLGVALLLAFGLKRYYSRAGCEELSWVLAPTAGLVEGVSGLSFVREAGVGFVNRAAGIVIAPSCSGVNFLIIAFSMIAVIGIGRTQSFREQLAWLASAMAGAYVFTLLVNTLRIVGSIHLYQTEIYYGWITRDRVHRIQGVMIYFCALCAVYFIVCKVRRYLNPRDSAPGTGGASWVPLAWYLAFVILIPLANSHEALDGRFLEHCITVFAGCTVILLVGILIKLARTQGRQAS